MLLKPILQSFRELALEFVQKFCLSAVYQLVHLSKHGVDHVLPSLEHLEVFLENVKAVLITVFEEWVAIALALNPRSK